MSVFIKIKMSGKLGKGMAGFSWPIFPGFFFFFKVMPAFSGHQVEIVGGKSVNLGLERANCLLIISFFPR